MARTPIPSDLTRDEDFYITTKTSSAPPLTVNDLLEARKQIDKLSAPMIEADLEYFRQKLFSALAVPPSYLTEPRLVAMNHDEHIYEVRIVPECERGPGIAALDLTPKRDNTVWMLDEDLLCDDAD